METKNLTSLIACQLTVAEMSSIRGGEGDLTATPIKTGEGGEIVL